MTQILKEGIDFNYHHVNAYDVVFMFEEAEVHKVVVTLDDMSTFYRGLIYSGFLYQGWTIVYGAVRRIKNLSPEGFGLDLGYCDCKNCRGTRETT